MSTRPIEIMDTTLRDGEQTSGVSFSATEKLTLAKELLLKLKVDRIEVASARVSKGEFDAVKEITTWAKSAGLLDRVEVLTFVDKGVSLDWMVEAGATVQNLLTKGSLNHLTHQLRKTPEQHFADIEATIKDAQSRGITTNVYLEDWSNGMRNSEEYVLRYLDFLNTQPIKRVLLPDTLGILTYKETGKFIKKLIKRYPNLHFDFHAHNDYDLSVANVMEAIESGVQGLHLTINGMGERAGNAPMASVIAIIKDFLSDQVRINVEEKSLYRVSKLTENFSGFNIPVNKPVVGENVFTQTAGIHADGDIKKNLYYNDLLPERFDRKRKYALGKTSGKANIEKNLKELGWGDLPSDQIKRITQKIIELGDKKKFITQEDLPFIVSDVLDLDFDRKVVVESYSLTSSKGRIRPAAVVGISIDGEFFEEVAQGDGQFDAFMNALRKIYEKNNLEVPKLTDYVVRIPPGSSSDALCNTVISWKIGNKEFTTHGLDSDQIVSSIQATEKMLNLILLDVFLDKS